jgi:hypothetical protein
MPDQAQELIRRLHRHYSDDELTKKWVMVLITVGWFLNLFEIFGDGF